MTALVGQRAATSWSRAWLVAIATLAAAGLVWGWSLFWFLTDDAHIAFRYVNNSLLGYGYVWNPPPFQPVEGYTSLLWVVLLDLVWRVGRVEPPDSANVLSLLFSALTLVICARMVLRMELGPKLESKRLSLLALVLLGILSNRTFLAWTSSGLETALFNCALIWWVHGMCSWRGWLVPSLAAAVACLTRPDGLLFVAVTGLALVGRSFVAVRRGTFAKRSLLGALPLLAVPAHLLWRHATYGEWLPNTYYAKVVAAWPEAGVRYLASFVLEYALWVWLGLAVAWLCCRGRSTLRGLSPGAVLALLTIALHVGYYTFRVGGDHFEYRVFSYLVPLVFVSLPWLLARLGAGPMLAPAVLLTATVLSWPLPWLHFALTPEPVPSNGLKIRVAPSVPAPLRWYAAAFDNLQEWLIDHAICIRQQEHASFYRFQQALFPPRSDGMQVPGEGFPVWELFAVGVPGWNFPHVIILDLLGLNDRVVAHSALVNWNAVGRRMAHERAAPPGYARAFAPNARLGPRQPPEMGRHPHVLIVDQRATPLTAELIRTIESAAWDEVHRRPR